MGIIPNHFMDAVVALGVDAGNGEKLWIGTGFIVGRRETNDSSLSTCYIITNKHVINGKQQLVVRFNALGGELVKDYPLTLFDSSGNALFSAHPNPSSDVVAIQIAPQMLINDKSIWGAVDLSGEALTLEQMQIERVEEGNLVYALGFPMGLVDTIKTPICRLGCISRIIDAFVYRNNGFPIFLVDAQVFPGNSGGPIISRPELYVMSNSSDTKVMPKLIGILSSYLSYKDTLVSQQTGEVRMVQTENSGLTVVHPVDRIKEVVELEWERIEKQKATRLTMLQEAIEEVNA